MHPANWGEGDEDNFDILLPKIIITEYDPEDSNRAIKMKTLKWDTRYLEMAKLVATWSKDPGHKIGAVAVGEHGQILSTGYNGLPRKLRDFDNRLTNRDLKLKHTIHAEMNVIYNASLTNVSLRDASLYVYGLPCCSSCSLGIIQSGINRVVITSQSLNDSDFWTESWQFSKSVFEEAGIEIVEVDYE